MAKTSISSSKATAKATKVATAKSPDVLSLLSSEKDALLFQLNILRKQRGESPQTKPEFESHVAEYLRFLSLKLSYPLAQPSDTIDHMWHAHILCTSAYAAFATRHNGSVFIHHNPVGGTAGGYTETLALYKKHFGKAAPKKFWPSVPPEVSATTAAAASALIASTTTTTALPTSTTTTTALPTSTTTTAAAATKAKKKSSKVVGGGTGSAKIAPKAAKKSSKAVKASGSGSKTKAANELPEQSGGPVFFASTEEVAKHAMKANEWKKKGFSETYKDEFLHDAMLGYGPGGRRGGYSGCG